MNRSRLRNFFGGPKQRSHRPISHMFSNSWDLEFWPMTSDFDLWTWVTWFQKNTQPAKCHATRSKILYISKLLAGHRNRDTQTPDQLLYTWTTKKGSPYSITERRVPELITVLGSQPAGDVNHKPDGRLPLLSARPAVTPATLKRGATNFAAWWTEAQWVWTVCLRLLPDSVATAIWTRALLRPAR